MNRMGDTIYRMDEKPFRKFFSDLRDFSRWHCGGEKCTEENEGNKDD